MAVTSRTLVGPKYAENSQTTQYTTPALGRTIIDKFTVSNVDTVNRLISVNIVASGNVAGASNLIVKTRVLAPGETYTFPMVVGHTLEPGAFISTLASAASSLVLYVSGRETT